MSGNRASVIRHLKALPPADAGHIDEILKGVPALRRFDMPLAKASEVETSLDKLRQWRNLIPSPPTFG